MATYFLTALAGTESMVDAAVQSKFAKDESLQIEAGKWLLNSPSVTSKDISDSLGISDAATFFMVPVRGYFGRARPDIWEWLAAKVKTGG